MPNEKKQKPPSGDEVKQIQIIPVSKQGPPTSEIPPKLPPEETPTGDAQDKNKKRLEELKELDPNIYPLY